MKKLLLFFVVALLSFQVNAQNWGFWDATRSTVTVNGISYSLWNSGAGSFQGANLGTYNVGSTLPLTAYSVNTWKSYGGDVTGSTYYYLIYATGNRPASPVFTSMGGGWMANIGSNGDQTWGASSLSVNILSGLLAGNYTLEIYGQIDGTGTPSGTQYDNNNSNATNYTATFTVQVGAGVATVPNDFILSVANKTISARFSGTATIQLLTISGQLIQNIVANGKFEKPVQQGSYIVKINGKSYKVVVP